MSLSADKKGGFEFALKDELASGVWKDNFSTRIPLWQDGQNVQATELGIAKIKGWGALTSTGGTEPIRGIAQNSEVNVISGLTDFNIYFGDLSALYYWNYGTQTTTTIGTGYSMTLVSGATSWDSSTTTWDSTLTEWDAGLNFSDHWSFATFGTFVLATNGGDAPQIKKNNVNFVNLGTGITGISITSGGTGYSVADPVTFTGGAGSGAAAEVSAVSSGVITQIKITNAGSGYTSVPVLDVTSAGTGVVLSGTISNLDVSSILLFEQRGPYILGFNTSTNDKGFIWNSADDVDDWIPTLSNTAGDLVIRELTSPIRATAEIGDRIAVYGDDQMFLVNYVGTPNVFGYQPAINGIGAVSSKAVASVGRKNFGLSKQGFYVTDGVTFNYIDEPQVRKFFQGDVARDNLSQTTAYHNEADNEVRWYYVSGSSSDSAPDKGLAYNYNTGNWAPLLVDRTACVERTLFEFPVVGDINGNLFFENSTNDDAGAAITSFVRTKGIDGGSATSVKELDSIRIGWRGAGLTYRVGGAETEGGLINWSGYKLADAGYEEQFLRTAGRWIYLEFYSDGLDDNWEIDSVDLIGRIEGSR